MKVALITGVSGQDGSYMAQLLLAKGYRVVGTVRSIEVARSKVTSILGNNIELVEWDMLDAQRIVNLLAQFKPDEIFNFGAFSSGAGMFDDAIGIGEVNGLAVTKILEAIRSVNDKIRFCQASSSEMFGSVTESPQSEDTPFRPRSPYGAAKLYAHSMIDIYRKTYGLFACSAILFNHESPRRGENFVSRKISIEVAKIKKGLVDHIKLGNLDARRDWGFAGDYVKAMWLMLQQSTADDYVISTGITHSVRDMCELAFDSVGLNYEKYVTEDKSVCRPREAYQLVGVADKARDKLNWRPEVSFNEMIQMMVEADLGKFKN